MAAEVLAFEAPDECIMILRRHQRFLQWDGCGRTSSGELVAKATPGVGPIEPIPSLSAIVPAVDAGPLGHAQTPVFLDQPEHTRFKKALVRDWNAASAPSEMKKGVFESAITLVQSRMRAGSVEFMRDIAAPLSASTLAAFFGGPARPWLDITMEHSAICADVDDSDQSALQLARFSYHIWNLIGERAHRNGRDTLSRMVMHSGSPTGLTLQEVKTVVVQMAFAANYSTILMLGWLALLLSERPKLRAELRHAPRAVIENVVNEMLCLHPPMTGLYRRTIGQTAVGTTEIPARCGLLLRIERANRSYVDLQVESKDMRPVHGTSGLTFGQGIHRCPGRRLVMLEAVALVRALTEPRELQPGSVSMVPDWLYHGPKELELVIKR